MFLIDVFFRAEQPLDFPTACHFLNNVIDQWRYNGQIIGREIPIFAANMADENDENQQGYAMHVLCPEQHSLLPEWNNELVTSALEQASNAGLIIDNMQIVAQDLNGEPTSDTAPNWQVLYTTYLQTCSPLQTGENLQPRPLYRALQTNSVLAKECIKWQENWQACDELQMNASPLENVALNAISDVNSDLAKHGRNLCREIENHTNIPTYYYLYRVGGETLEKEQNRTCPHCQQAWKLDKPLNNIFNFKCDNCRLVSNLSWDFQ